MKTTLFLPVTLDNAPGTAASLRFRALWPARYWEGADVYPTLSRPMSEYDQYIFQKAYLTDAPRRFLEVLSGMGKPIAFDLCDADWLLSSEHEQKLLRVLPKCTVAVAPTEALVNWLERYCPAHVIPDRVPIMDYVRKPKHEHDHIGPATACWFGYAHNLRALEPMREAIRRVGIPVTLITNEWPDAWRVPGISFVRWTLEGADAEIARHDIAIIPPASPWKSDNRVTTAMALGVLPARTPKVLENMAGMRVEQRAYAAACNWEWIRGHRDVRKSADQWQVLFDMHRSKQ